MTDIVDRLRAMGERNEGLPWSACHEAADEIDRLRAENADLRRWKALDKPLTAAMAIAIGRNR